MKQKDELFEIFAVRQIMTNTEDSFWSFYDSLEDAVRYNNNNCEVFLFEGKSIGRYIRKVELVTDKECSKRK